MATSNYCITIIEIPLWQYNNTSICFCQAKLKTGYLGGMEERVKT
jgi:hypothetical protein